MRDKAGQSASTNFHIFSREKRANNCSTIKTKKTSSAQQISIPVDYLTKILVNEANISVLYGNDMDPYMGHDYKSRYI